MERFKRDPAFGELGGLSYLANLVDRAPPAANAADYGRLVYDLAIRRELIRIGGEIAVAAQTDAEHSAKDQIETAEQTLYSLAETGQSSTGFVTFADALHGAVEMAAEAYSRDGGLAGISTGLIDMDRMIGGLHPSDLIILAGRPSMGKSALAANIAFHVAKSYAYDIQPDGSRKTSNGGVVAFFSLEMSAEQLAMRVLAEVSGVPSDRLRKGEIDASEFGRVRDAALEIQQAPLHFDDTGGLSLSKLTARARRLKRQTGLDLIVIDYLQLITAGETSRNDNRVQEVSMITQGLKALAKELAVPVIALSQLSRQVENREDKRPQLSDLRESGSIEQDADMVMFVYRESYYLGRAQPREGTPEHLAWQEDLDKIQHIAEVIIGKQRHGPIGTVKLHFNADLTKFSNLAREGRFEGR
jgi:replicative DNA helicase